MRRGRRERRVLIANNKTPPAYTSRAQEYPGLPMRGPRTSSPCEPGKGLTRNPAASPEMPATEMPATIQGSGYLWGRGARRTISTSTPHPAT